ncbi:thioredoxin domain-containing protein, partial [Mycobacterium intermedium]
PHRPDLELLVVPLRHDANNLPSKEGVHQTRGGSPTFEASSEKHPDIVYAKVDTEAEQELAAAAQIQSIPTLMAFKKGKLLFNQAGALPPAALESLVQQLRDFDVDAAQPREV